jgi:NAD(P)-dependent dehydrogenase (short-subunit alcohol dehydrogenase family)
MSDGRIWFITGASRGIGRAIAEAALAAGDQVVAAARDVGGLEELAGERLLPLTLDVSDRAAVFAAVAQAVGHFGRIDIVVNNAGAMLYGMVEEASEEQLRAHYDVNLFGAVWVLQATIPHLRAQGGGRILNVTTMGVGGGRVPAVGFYAAGKSALDALTLPLAAELEGFGVKVTSLQMGGYETGLFTRGLTWTDPNPAYDELRAAALAAGEDQPAQPAPETIVPAILALVDEQEPPQRLVVGGASFDMVAQLERQRADERRAWEQLSRLAPG